MKKKRRETKSRRREKGEKESEKKRVARSSASQATVCLVMALFAAPGPPHSLVVHQTKQHFLIGLAGASVAIVSGL